MIVRVRSPLSVQMVTIPSCLMVPSSLVVASVFVVLMASPLRAVRVMTPDWMVTLSLPLRALSSQSTTRVRFLTSRSSFEWIPLLFSLYTVRVPLPWMSRSVVE